MKREEVEAAAMAESQKRYNDEVANTLGGVRHGFIEGALWWASKQDRRDAETKH